MHIHVMIQKDHVFGHSLHVVFAMLFPLLCSFPRVVNGQEFPGMKSISVCPGIA